MAAKRQPKRVEIGLRFEDMVVLREASRVGRSVLVAQLRTLKAEMQHKISTVERLDDALDRLDVAIAKAATVYSVDMTTLEPATSAPGEGDR